MKTLSIKFYKKTETVCRQCDATQRWLNQHGHTDGGDYETLSLEENPQVATAGKVLGHMQAPVLIVTGKHGVTHVWGGFNPDALAEHIGGEKVTR